jgi:hypothetical protein
MIEFFRQALKLDPYACLGQAGTRLRLAARFRGIIRGPAEINGLDAAGGHWRLIRIVPRPITLEARSQEFGDGRLRSRISREQLH